MSNKESKNDIFNIFLYLRTKKPQPLILLLDKLYPLTFYFNIMRSDSFLLFFQ